MKTLGLASLVIGTFLSLTFNQGEGQELKRIKIGYPAISYNQIHIWVAKQAGLFNSTAWMRKPEQFVDLSLLQELEREGFFTELAKRYP